MTVANLIEALEYCNKDAEVFLGNPNHFGSNYQDAHEQVGVRYVVNGNEEVWFETYDGEDIAEEVRAVSDAAVEQGWGDEEIVMELINPDCHGYTWSDLHKNLRMEDYLWLRAAAKEHGLL